MRFTCGTIGLFACCALVGCCCGVPPNSSSSPKPFTSQPGNFRASFPTEPTHHTSDDGLEHRYTSETRRGRVVFRASYELNAGIVVSPAERMQITTDELGAQDVTIRSLILQGFPGAEARYSTHDPDGTIHVRHRVYHVGDTSYQVIVGWEDGLEVTEAANRFFNSFELIDPPSP